MRAGAAIITSKGTGCAEVVGDTALLVEPRSPDSIRGALTRLTSDRELCRRLSVAAQARMRDNFTWPAVASRYLQCYPAPRLSPAGVPAVADVA
jgi:glycosyltransferase involved in cell wall biosynthesis